jgi:DNA-binding NtrC family response regulator
MTEEVVHAGTAGDRPADLHDVTVLWLGPFDEDHLALVEMFAASRWSMSPGSPLTLRAISSLDSALLLLQHNPVPVVMCERDFGGGTWKDVLAALAALPNPPSLIVTSRIADASLWAEALNLGVYDVLAKPFDKTEVERTITLAWLHWHTRHPRPAP